MKYYVTHYIIVNKVLTKLSVIFFCQSALSLSLSLSSKIESFQYLLGVEGTKEFVNNLLAVVALPQVLVSTISLKFKACSVW